MPTEDDDAPTGRSVPFLPPCRVLETLELPELPEKKESCATCLLLHAPHVTLEWIHTQVSASGADVEVKYRMLSGVPVERQSYSAPRSSTS